MPFKPGQSGNPGGRPKTDQDFIALAKSRGMDALNVLCSIMADDKVSAAARVSAAAILLDRGYGKAIQQLKHEGEMSQNFAEMLREARQRAEAAMNEFPTDNLQNPDHQPGAGLDRSGWTE